MIDDLKSKVATATDSFFRKDSKLLGLKVYEAAVSHRIAFYLEELLQSENGYRSMELNIDCEYNKDLDNPKKGEDGKGIRPDILVHKRAERTGNLVAVEIKKQRKSLRDEAKLKDLTNNGLDFKYKLGVFIYFPGDTPRIIWFVDGKIDGGIWYWSKEGWWVVERLMQKRLIGRDQNGRLVVLP